MPESLPIERIQFESTLSAIFEGLNTGVVGGVGTTITLAEQSIINFVKAKLDEVVPEGIPFSLSINENISDPLNLLIYSQLPESVKDICLSAPPSVLVPTSITGNGTVLTDNKTGYIALPVNFLRLVSFRMTDWTRDAIVTVPGTPLAKKQSNKYTRGGIAKPVAILIWKNIATVLTRALEYYSVKSLHTVDGLFFIPEQTPEVFITVNPILMDSLAWQCASKILQIINKMPEAKAAQERVVQSYINLI